ncbi:MAG: hypothetical protein SPL06_02185 [Bacteroidales bacterium]|nr:hypothetical protein [Bacteroidales bacterium]MDY6382078.1 hypothetical protein [Bacteroidales bacterium]MDY6393453.1 hypothetical protein [Bacteroidales bacterium]MDY6423551.1 hypothetical protein [Bacteroidales bacterium]
MPKINIKRNNMQLSTMNPAQIMILESFASVKDSNEMNDLMEVLKMFYAKRLEKEMQRLWDNGTLDAKALNNLKQEHLRTPYNK